ncbi:MAG: hypothetical protein K2O18_02195 [Oscillospiraceae bacterium]|nr:hypothetical protein [Oscillospiraceae bacterium]
MSGIRVAAAVKNIEVNDNGDFITLNFSDNSLPDRFFHMLERVQNRAESVRPKEREIREQFDENDEERVKALAALYRELHEGIMQEVDALLGPDTCKKVFGNIVPGIELFDDFFCQLIPYFEEYSRDRAQKLSKYSPDRTGNV